MPTSCSEEYEKHGVYVLEHATDHTENPGYRFTTQIGSCFAVWKLGDGTAKVYSVSFARDKLNVNICEVQRHGTWRMTASDSEKRAGKTPTIDQYVEFPSSSAEKKKNGKKKKSNKLSFTDLGKKWGSSVSLKHFNESNNNQSFNSRPLQPPRKRPGKSEEDRSFNRDRHYASKALRRAVLRDQEDEHITSDPELMALAADLSRLGGGEPKDRDQRISVVAPVKFGRILWAMGESQHPSGVSPLANEDAVSIGQRFRESMAQSLKPIEDECPKSKKQLARCEALAEALAEGVSTLQGFSEADKGTVMCGCTAAVAASGIYVDSDDESDSSEDAGSTNHSELHLLDEMWRNSLGCKENPQPLAEWYRAGTNLESRASMAGVIPTHIHEK